MDNKSLRLGSQSECFPEVIYAEVRRRRGWMCNPESRPGLLEQRGIRRLTVYCRREQECEENKSALHCRLHDQESPLEFCLTLWNSLEVASPAPRPGQWRTAAMHSLPHQIPPVVFAAIRALLHKYHW